MDNLPGRLIEAGRAVDAGRRVETVVENGAMQVHAAVIPD
jgi:hypothetical protein